MGEDQGSAGWWRPGTWPLVVAVLASIAVGLLLAVGLIELFSHLAYETWQPWKKAANVKVPDLVKLALAIVAGIGAAQALVVGYRRQRITEEDLSGQREQRRLWTQRFGAAATQLGGDHAAVRLAGVYAMAALADEWEEQQQQCIDVLCGYLRLPYDPTAPDVPGAREVRLTIIKVISDHLRAASSTNWMSRDFDFTGAVFDGGNFSGATFLGGAMLFEEAEFSAGTMLFSGAEFAGGSVSFNR